MFISLAQRLTACAAGLAALALGMGAAAQSAPVQTEASHALIMDFDTGAVLFSKNGDEPMPPASMSKLMTMLMVFERIKSGSLRLEDTFIVSEDAWRRGGFASGSSTMCLEPNVEVSVEDLIRGVIILSGNDASIVLAEALSGSEEAFADEMNARAVELGLDSATFVNATGWPDPDHRISALDLAKVARTIIRDHADLYSIYSEATFDYCAEISPANRFNRNPLLGSFEGADGLKTGRTRESGFGLVASAERRGQRRIVVFNGMETGRGRAREARRLMTAAFRDFQVAEPYAAGDVVAEAAVFLGVEQRVALTVADPVKVAFHRRAARDVEGRIELDEALRAPVVAGTEVGRLIVTVPGSEPVEAPVFAAADVPRLGIGGRALAALAHLIRSSDG